MLRFSLIALWSCALVRHAQSLLARRGLVPENSLGGLNCKTDLCRSMQRSTAPVPDTQLCRSDSVEVVQRGSGTREFRFTDPTHPAKVDVDYHDAEVQCDAAASAANCTAATQCTACSCMGFSLVHDFNEALVERFLRSSPCQDGAGQREANVLIVGMGPGVVARAVAESCPLAQIQAVEVSAQVASAAERYVLSGVSGLDQRLQIDVEDGGAAAEALAGSGRSFDSVIVDCMTEGDTPMACRNDEFVKHMKDLLRPGGSLQQWVWHGQRDELEERYRAAFPAPTWSVSEFRDGRMNMGSIIEVHGNSTAAA